MSLSELLRHWLLQPVMSPLHDLQRTAAMNHAELAQALSDLAAQTDKAKAEVVAKVAELEAAIVAAGQTDAAVDAALEALKASVQGVDDLNPDA
jgi:hypothetical protein